MGLKNYSDNILHISLCEISKVKEGAKMRAKEIPGRRTIWVFTRNMQQNCASFLEQHYWKINNAWITLFHWKDCIETALISWIKSAKYKFHDQECLRDWEVKFKMAFKKEEEGSKRRGLMHCGGLAARQTRTLNYHMAATNLDCLILLDISTPQRNVKTPSKTPKLLRSSRFHTLVMFKSPSAKCTVLS